MALLEIDHLSFRVPERALLDGLELTVAAGEIHALVGTNGTGKSTLAYLIMGCEGYRPETGEIRFDGQRIDGLPLHERARLGISLAWQEPARFEGLSVRDYLSLGRGKVDAQDCLQRVGLSPADYLNRMVDKTLSGGERQMLMIGRALLGSPKVLLIDEPTEGLAPSIVAHLKNVLKELSKKTALVIVEQNLPLVCAISDKIYAIKEGRIVTELIGERITANVCEGYL